MPTQTPNIPTANNNPGDIKDPATGQIMKFNSPQEGYAALLNDLETKKSGQSKTGLAPTSTLADFSKVYAPSSDKNDPAQYTANLANKMGVSPDAQLKDLDVGKWADAIAHNEGYQGQLPSSQNSNAPGVQTAAAAGSMPAPKSLGQEVLGGVEGIGNALFPAVKDVYNDVTGQNTGANKKTFLQQAGDTALSALPFIPGLGEFGEGARAADLGVDAATQAAKVGGEIAAKAAPAAVNAAPTLGSKVIPGILNSPVARSVAMGYGSDVGSNLSQGKTGADAFTPGLGTLTGGVLGVGSKALAGGGTGAASKLVNSLVKPLLKDFAYGKNPGRAIAEEGITGNSLEDLTGKIAAVRQQVGEKIGEMGKNMPQLNLNLAPSLKPIDDAMEEAAKQNNSAAFSRLQEVKKALTQNLGMGMDETGAPAIVSKGARNLTNQAYLDAQELKQRVGDMTRWTGNASDDKAVNLALKKVYGNLTDTMQKGVESVPGVGKATLAQLQKLNQRYGDLLTAESATKYRSAIEGRQNMIGLGDKVLGGTGLIGGLLSGGPVGAALGGAAGAAAGHVLGSTAFKTRAAKALAGGGAKSVLGKSPGLLKGILPSLLKAAAVRTASSQNK